MHSYKNPKNSNQFLTRFNKKFKTLIIINLIIDLMFNSNRILNQLIQKKYNKF